MLEVKLPQWEGNLKKFTDAVELAHVEAALQQSKGSRTRAAKILGINRTTLVMKLIKFGMHNPKKKLY